jgi:hypothetical protein
MKRNLFLLFCTSLLLAGFAQAAPNFYAGAHASPRLPALAAQVGSGHTVTLTWGASTSAATCLSTSTPPCTFSYSVFRGTASGAESAIALNTAPITGTSYTDSTVTLGSSPITYFYVVEAIETVGGVTVASAPSNEAAATFPGIPASPPGVVATPH